MCDLDVSSDVLRPKMRLVCVVCRRNPICNHSECTARQSGYEEVV